MGILADTHIPGGIECLPASVVAAMQGVDLIVHAGDVIAPVLVEDLQRLAPVVVSTGNGDPADIRENWGESVVFEAEGWRIGVCHGHLGRGRNALERSLNYFTDRNLDVIIFGHSHQPTVQVQGKKMLLNPGSPTIRRWFPRLSYGLLEAEKGILRGTVVFFEA